VLVRQDAQAVHDGPVDRRRKDSTVWAIDPPNWMSSDILPSVPERTEQDLASRLDEQQALMPHTASIMQLHEPARFQRRGVYHQRRDEGRRCRSSAPDAPDLDPGHRWRPSPSPEEAGRCGVQAWGKTAAEIHGVNIESPCSVAWRGAVHPCSVQFGPFHLNSFQHNSVQCYSIQFTTIHSVQSNSIEFNSVQSHSSPFNPIQFNSAQYTPLRYATLHNATRDLNHDRMRRHTITAAAARVTLERLLGWACVS
jgi:hypothetical protein